jgi:hypothetical protein
MITDFLLGLLAGVIQWVLGLLPAWSFHLPVGLADYIANMKYFDDILPISEVLHCVTLACTLFTAMTTYKLVIKLADWIADVIP